MPLWQPARILNRQGSRCARVGDAVNVGKTYVGDLKGESDAREFYRVPAGFSARRDRLVQDLVRKCRDGGMAVVSAPAGFGKTALLLQYADSIKEDMTRGDVGLIDAQGMRPAELGERLRRLQRDIAPTASPVVIVDNMPRLGKAGLQRVVDTLFDLRDQGFEIVVSCLPTNHEFVKAVGESSLIPARSLLVQPREYAQWARLYSISASLDVYHLTQGVPALIAMLQSISSQEADGSALNAGILGIYQAILNNLQQARDGLFRIVCFMLAMGSGTIADLEACGVRVKPNVLLQLSRDWPVFGFAVNTGEFKCLGLGAQIKRSLQQMVARLSSQIVSHAGRMLVKASRFDDAVELCENVLEDNDAIALLAMRPTGFVLSGHGLFISRLLGRHEASTEEPLEAGALLAACLAALTLGDLRLARAAALELRKRAYDMERDVDPTEWACACAFVALWDSCAGISLPTLSEHFCRGARSSHADRLEACIAAYDRLMAGDGNIAAYSAPDPLPQNRRCNGVDLLEILESTVEVLKQAFCGRPEDLGEAMSRLSGLRDVLLERRLLPCAARVRMAQAVGHLMRLEPIADERAFIDANTMAVRQSDLPTQLFCLAAEGWQALTLGQVMNAQFRGQQVEKLADKSNIFLRGWAHLLVQSAQLRDASMITVREQADLLDLATQAKDPAWAWSTALHLSAARFDAELSAWFSMHRSVLLDSSFATRACLAMSVLGDRSDSARRLVPLRHPSQYRGVIDEAKEVESYETMFYLGTPDVGQVTINLFGGFHVLRNGHTLTDEVWKRKKASALAARLVLSIDTFVDRRVISEEMWPEMDYAHARKSLYTALSSLRGALSQRKDGPQYVVTQADAISFNGDYVTSDIRRFDALAREVLLRKTGRSAQEVIDDCLKLEEVYAGPLFIPSIGNTQFFVQLRRMYQSKFIDCMIRGIDLSVEAGNTASATWLVEAALRQEATREDVIRRAMAVFDLCGRRREVVELYNSHLHYLEHEVHALPEEKTRIAYEQIIGRSKAPVML